MHTTVCFIITITREYACTWYHFINQTIDIKLLYGLDYETRNRQFYATIYSNKKGGASLPEPNTAQTEEAADLVLTYDHHRAGEALRPTEIPGLIREDKSRQISENLGLASKDVVSKQANEMEVRFLFYYSLEKKYKM